MTTLADPIQTTRSFVMAMRCAKPDCLKQYGRGNSATFWPWKTPRSSLYQLSKNWN